VSLSSLVEPEASEGPSRLFWVTKQRAGMERYVLEVNRGQLRLIEPSLRARAIQTVPFLVLGLLYVASFFFWIPLTNGPTRAFGVGGFLAFTVGFMILVIFIGRRLQKGMLKGPHKITDLTLLAVRRNRIGGVRLRVASKDMNFPGTSQLVDSQELVVVGSRGRILDALGIEISELPWDKY